jgi:hypothetical protein
MWSSIDPIIVVIIPVRPPVIVPVVEPPSVPVFHFLIAAHLFYGNISISPGIPTVPPFAKGD